MIITSSYLGKSLGPYRCLFFLLLEDYIDEQTQFVSDLKPYLERFARNLGDAAALVRSFQGDIETTREEVLSKRWSERQLNEIRKTPSLLMIEQDFYNFDPQQHPWIQINLGRTLHRETGNVNQVGEMLNFLAAAVTDSNNDVFEIAYNLQNEIRLSDAAKVFIARPGIGGFSIDLIQGAGILRTLIQRLFDRRSIRTRGYR